MNLRTAVTGVFSAVLVGLVIWYLTNHWDAISQIRFVRPEYLILLTALLLIRICLRGYFHWQVMRSLDVDIPVHEVLELNFAGTMMNQLLPMPVGAGYRATYLKNRYQFPFSLFASTLAALFVYGLLVSASLGLAAMGWFYFREGKFEPIAALTLGAVVLACVSMFVFPLLGILNTKSRGGWFVSRAEKTLEGWKTLITSRKLIVGASAVVALSTLVGAYGIIVAFQVIGVSVSFAGAILLLASQHVGSLIKLTPGAIGYQEMVGIYFATLLAPTTAEAAVVFGMARLISTLVAVVFGMPALWRLTGRSPAPSKVAETEHE